jgi:FkbM family methyltransferase
MRKKLRGLLYLSGRNLGKWLHRHRNSAIAADTSRFLTSVGHGYLNQDNYVSEKNGEYALLRRLADCPDLKFQTVFDVGANRGEWAMKVRALFAQAHIHCFEIAEPTYDKLVQSLGQGYVTNMFGLGATEKTVTLKYAKDADVLTSTVKILQNFPCSEISGKIVAGDDYIRDNNIPYVDFLKIDVEGMEGEVLSGFRKAFAEHKIRIIQFEYGPLNIYSHFLLRDFYDFLEPYGFVVGRIYPDYVDFFEFDNSKENFAGSNFIAVQKNDIPALKALANPG